MKPLTCIAFLCHPYHRGGVTSWMASAAEETAKRGIKTYFITVAPSKPFISSGNKPSMLTLLENSGKELSIITQKAGFEFELGTSSYRSITYKNMILRNIPEGTPIIVSDDYSVWYAASLLADKYPMIGVLHSDDVAYTKLAKEFYHYVSKFIAVSNRVALNVKDIISDIAVIPCGIKTDIYKKKIELKPDTLLRITWVGRVDEHQKRVSDVIKIALSLKKKNVVFNIYVLGSGPDYETFKKEIDNHNLAGQVKPLGWQSSQQIIDILHTTDLLLQTSNFEGMSVAVMEALASGCGIVSSRVSGVEDYEYNEIAQNCLSLYEIGNIDEAVEKIIFLSQIPCSTRQDAATKMANRDFSIETCLNQYTAVINEINTPLKKPNHLTNNLFSVSHSYILSALRLVKHRVRT